MAPVRTTGAGPRPRKEGSRPTRCIRSPLNKMELRKEGHFQVTIIAEMGAKTNLYRNKSVALKVTTCLFLPC